MTALRSGLGRETRQSSRARYAWALLSGWLIAGWLIAGDPRVAIAQQLDYSATYLSGLWEFQDEISGRLIVADTAVFFTQRNGEPIFVLPYRSITDAYGTLDLGANDARPRGHYLVIGAYRNDQDVALVFSASPFVADTITDSILVRLDARRSELYASRPRPDSTLTAAASDSMGSPPQRNALTARTEVP